MCRVITRCSGSEHWRAALGVTAPANKCSPSVMSCCQACCCLVFVNGCLRNVNYVRSCACNCIGSVIDAETAFASGWFWIAEASMPWALKFFQLPPPDLRECIRQCPFTSLFIIHMEGEKPQAWMAWKICRHLRKKWEIHWWLCELPLFILYIMQRRLNTIIVDLFVLTHSCGCWKYRFIHGAFPAPW